MTEASFYYLDPTTLPKGTRAWNKVDVDAKSWEPAAIQQKVNNIRGREHEFGTDVSGFAVYHDPAHEKTFTDDGAVREGYYAEVEAMLRKRLPGVKKVVIFDHTIRRRIKDAPRGPIQQVHVDQTPAAADVRVRRHLPAAEAEELLSGRYQIINVWRPIENAASDFPLAVVDWRSTQPADFIPVDLLYPKRADSAMDDANDDRGKEVRAAEDSWRSTEGYEVKGETMAVAPNESHTFWYQKDMTPEEVMLLKCYDSRGQGAPNGHGVKGLALRTPHTAFIDPATPAEAPARQSIEVRCLVFYE